MGTPSATVASAALSFARHLREPAPEPVPDPRLQAAEAARMAEARVCGKLRPIVSG